MPKPRDYAHSKTIRYYRNFGDERPPVSDLKDILRQLEATGPEHLGATLVKGEVCLDLAAAEPDGAQMWVNRADEALNEADHRASILRVRPYTAQFARRAAIIVSASLRRAELGNWRRASQHLPPLNNYRDLLHAARDALPLLGLGLHDTDDKVQTTLIEAVPEILVARKRWLRSGDMLGRLALVREGRRGPLPDRKYNPNWDSGLYAVDDPAAFLRPAVRLEVKESFPERGRGLHGARYGTRWPASAYLAAGVVPLSASQYGFDDPRPVVLSCLEELDLGQLSPEMAEAKSLLPSQHLDAMTRSIQQEITLHAPDAGLSG